MSLDAKIGDKYCYKVFQNQSYLILSNFFSFEVVNFFSSGLQEYDKNIVYLNIEKAISLGYKSSEVLALLWTTMELFDKYFYPFYYETWKERHSLLFEWMLAQQWPAYIMFGLITFVGLINLFAAIAMIIIEKNGPITILICPRYGLPKLKKSFYFARWNYWNDGSINWRTFFNIIIGIQMKYSLFKIPSDVYFMDQIPFSFFFR